MLKILPFLKPYRIAIIVAIMLMLVELMVELLQPFLIFKIIDDGILQKNLSAVWLWGGAMVGFSILAFTAGMINSFYSSHVSQSCGFDARERLYEKVQSFPSTGFNLFSASSLITRMTNDVTLIQNTIFMSLRIALRAPLLVLGGVIMAVIVNARLALIIVVVVPLLLIFLMWVMKLAGPLFRAVQRKLDVVNSVMQENLAGMRLIKAFLRRKHEVQRFNQSSRELMDRTVTALRTIEITMPVVLLLMNLSVMAILWFGSVEVERRGASVGEVVAIVNYATRVTAALSIVSMIIMIFTRAKASIERVAEVLEIRDDAVDLQDSDPSLRIREGKLVFDSVCFQYPGSRKPLLCDLSFGVQPGETVAILGATGSGKSSLLQLIPRLYEVNQGAIYIDDIDIRLITFDHLRKSIGFVSQEALLFTGTVKENIKWGKETASEEEIVEAAKRAQIHDAIMKLPKQYDTMVGQKGVNLSGGQKQRLSIARALVRKPKILLLDDSTSALDINTETKLLHALQKYSCTTLMVTQKMSTAMRADTIMLLEDGALLVQGSHRDLLQRSSLYQRIYESQYGKEAVRHDEATK